MSEKSELRAQIRHLADRQRGHVARWQLLELGATRSWIRDQILRGYLIPVHAGVYAVGHVPRDAQCRAVAAVLACGEGAALSHWSAAALWDIAEWPAALEVTAPRRRSRSGLITHRSKTLTSHDLRRRHGVRVTSPLRTVLDLQPGVTDDQLVRLVNDLRTRKHLRATAFNELCTRSVRIYRLLGDSGLTESELEDLFRRFVARHGVPMPQLNRRLQIGGRWRRLDAFYPEAGLIVELDSWQFHGDRASFERDRAKDAAALAEGLRTLRATDRRLRGDGSGEAAIIRRILAETGD